MDRPCTERSRPDRELHLQWFQRVCQRFVRQIMSRADSLELFPMAGAVVPEIDRDDVRETFVKKYRLIYQVDQNEVRLLAVIHGARELPAAIVDRAT